MGETSQGKVLFIANYYHQSRVWRWQLRDDPQPILHAKAYWPQSWTSSGFLAPDLRYHPRPPRAVIVPAKTA